jgi:hypothetical protein
MKYLKPTKKASIAFPGVSGPLNIQAYELIPGPRPDTYQDLIDDLGAEFDVSCLTLSEDDYDNIRKKGYKLFNQEFELKGKGLYFFKKGLMLIDGNPNWDYIHWSKITFWNESGRSGIAEGPNTNEFFESWKKGDPEYENKEYVFFTLAP